MTFDPQEEQRKRLQFIITVMALFAVVVVVRLFYWQIWGQETINNEVPSPLVEVSPQEIYEWRGIIFDRHEYPMAIDVTQYKVTADPSELEDREEAAKKLAPALGRSVEELLSVLAKEESKYALLERRTDKSVGEAIKEMKLKGIEVIPRPKRVYPAGPLAGPVLGFVNEARDSYYGVEASLDESLRGANRTDGIGSFLGLEDTVPAGMGDDVVLTLDRDVQAIVERELKQGVERFKATGGSVIIMEPLTGAILAMAKYPTYDPNHYAVHAEGSHDIFLNDAVHKLYEPGSVMKVMTVAAGLDAGAVTSNSTYYDEDGMITYAGQTIENWGRRALGRTTMTDVLKFSLNVGAVHIADQLGSEGFYRYMGDFGFGQPTGVELPDELAGVMRRPARREWHESDLATNSFGQGISATPLQVVTAMAAVANDGLLMQPHIIKATIDDGVYKKIDPTVVRRVVSAQVTQQVTEMLTETVAERIKKAVPSGYTVAGKTGTSQIPVPGGYDPKWTIASFAGYAPANDPRIVMLVKIDKPEIPDGSDVAAPIFRDIAEEILPYLDVPTDEERLALEES